ncbi:MAG: CDC27 family protein [Sulfurimonas sp.]|uniref:CDC27 family protein n=1 Tax=Sulfurimonas sp. TaxID=2022749 RepID=UPI00261D41BD|nr:CDC27 family protein [Sulfurimonas sp.]MDD5373878.1 CDC27 family protein [Sulfurimonas sp.]
MLDIYDLEIRHKKYKQKQLLPYIAISASTAVVIASIAFFTLYDFDSKIEHQSQQQLVTQESIIKSVPLSEKPTPQNTIVKKEDTAATHKNIADKKDDAIIPSQETATKYEPATIKEDIKITQKEEKTEEKVVLSPSLNFINNIKSQIPPPLKKENDNGNANKEIKKSVAATQKKQEEAVNIVVTEEAKKIVATPQKRQETVVPVPHLAVEERLETASKADNKTNIDIKRKNNDEDDIKDVIKRFNVNHNPALSLFVAKRYYQLGEYENAYNYALATNEINNNMEESWIIFSKSLVKMNKKDQAVETLKKYISHSQSSQAKQLLDEIQSGKFK